MIFNCATHPLPLGAYLLNVVFFKIYQSPSTYDYSIPWLSILMLQWREGFVRLVMQFMMASTQIVYKLQIHMKFLSVGYKNGGMESRQKVQEHPQTRPLQRSKKVQFASILIDSTRSICVLARK